jgi:hypothetical protein
MKIAGADDPNVKRPQPADNYIPLRPADLVRKLGDEPAVTIFEREQLRRLCELLDATIHQQYRTRLNELKAAYAPFDPDDDAAAQFSLAEDQRGSRCRELFDDFDALLTRANYRRLSRADIEQAVGSPLESGLKLQLDLELFERLEVYVRGDCQLPRRSRSWRTFWRDQERAVPGYRRLAMIFRLRERSPLTDPLDTRAAVLKLFKDIPREDIETLLPGANVRMGLFEQAQIVVPTVSGLGLTMFKLLHGAMAVTFAGIYSLIAFLGLISGAIGYGVKSVYSYLRTREKHQLCLTRHLYFQNLDNNAGVIYHLLAEAEDQEFREAILAWWLLWRGGLAGATAEQIDVAAEAWLESRCGIRVDFEVADALAKLRRYGLAHECPASGVRHHPGNSDEGPTRRHREGDASPSPESRRWNAVSIEQALAMLDRAWDEQFDYHHPSSTAANPQTPRIWRAAA